MTDRNTQTYIRTHKGRMLSISCGGKNWFSVCLRGEVGKLGGEGRGFCHNRWSYYKHRRSKGRGGGGGEEEVSPVRIWDTNLALLVHQLPLWRLGELQGRGGGREGQKGPVGWRHAVEPRPFDLVVTGKRGETIPTEQHGRGLSSHFALVTRRERPPVRRNVTGKTGQPSWPTKPPTHPFTKTKQSKTKSEASHTTDPWNAQ